MQRLDPSAERARLLKRLAVVVSEDWPYTVRRAAIRAVQSMLPDVNPLKRVPADALLDQIKPPWETRTYLERGRGVRRPVQRPPQSIADVWGC